MQELMSYEAIRALGMSLVAGMSTMLGALIIFFTKDKNERVVSASLGFAAGVMISVSFVDLLPEAWDCFRPYFGDVWSVVLSVAMIVLGLLLSAGLDHLVPHETRDDKKETRKHSNLFRTGMVSMLAIGLHNFPEGMATFMAGYQDAALGISIMVAIAMHNIPEGITVAMPIYFGSGSRRRALKYTFYSGIAEPIGALLAFFILRPIINGVVLGVLFSIISGIMIYIAIEELLPSSRQYRHPRVALWSTFAGICVMPLTIVIK